MIKFAGFNAILMKQKIIFKTIAAAILILSAAVSCEWVDKVITGETVASVGKVRLSRAELNKALPSGLRRFPECCTVPPQARPENC